MQFALTDTATALKMQKAKYLWTPQGITPDQAEAYFAAIPKQCVPLLGTGEFAMTRSMYM